jgi:Holliday junction DNA helicase RuvA
VEKVNGVGPKLALTLLSFFPLSDLFSILFNRDDESLAKCPGVGKKTAQRLVLELHDYLKKLPVIKTNVSKKSIGLCKDAVEALVILGYQRKIAEELVAKVYAAEPQLNSVESLLKKAFQYAVKKMV